jgi:hypothetical protein
MTYNINFLRRDKIEISDALHTLCPGSSWSVDDTYDSIENFKSDDYDLPSENEINAEIERLQQEWENNQYQRDREKEYPKFAEQLDILYHKGYEGWKEEINKVKQKYPKPE